MRPKSAPKSLFSWQNAEEMWSPLNCSFIQFMWQFLEKSWRYLKHLFLSVYMTNNDDNYWCWKTTTIDGVKRWYCLVFVVFDDDFDVHFDVTFAWRRLFFDVKFWWYILDDDFLVEMLMFFLVFTTTLKVDECFIAKWDDGWWFVAATEWMLKEWLFVLVSLQLLIVFRPVLPNKILILWLKTNASKCSW